MELTPSYHPLVSSDQMSGRSLCRVQMMVARGYTGAILKLKVGYSWLFGLSCLAYCSPSTRGRLLDFTDTECRWNTEAPHERVHDIRSS